jgi:hypothetical protein
MVDQLTRLIQWLKKAGISWNEDRVLLRPCRDGLGVVAVEDIEEGKELCVIPKTAVLSVKNTGIADILEEHRIRGGLGLIIAIMYELGLGKASFW